MQRYLTLTILALLLPVLPISAQEDGTSCERAVPVEAYYRQSLTRGYYWFMSTTFFLPLEFYYFPEDTTEIAPNVWLDLTCEYDNNGYPVYEDPKIADMISYAGQYNLSFPMREEPELIYVDGKKAYKITYSDNYRNMLYNQGVTYEVPAYLKVFCRGNATIQIESTSMHSACRDETVTLLMNTALPIVPSDSDKIYVWPIGEWLDKDYRIYWEGSGGLQMVEGADCSLTKYTYVESRYQMPSDTIKMTSYLSKEMVKDRYTTETYVRMYPQSSGLLHIEEIDTISKVTEYIIEGIPAAIDQENLTITAILPYGTVRSTAITNAQVSIYVTEPEQNYYSYNKPKTILFVGDILQYTLNITVAPDTRSPDASLASFTIGDSIFSETNGNFNPCQLIYEDVETTDNFPMITAQANNAAATVLVNRAGVGSTATIIVTAEAGNTQTYQIRLIPKRSTDATLSALYVDDELIEGFNPNITLYEKEMLAVPVVTAEATDPNIRDIRIFQTNRIPGYAYVQVTAEAGNTKAYTVNFTLNPIVHACSQRQALVAREYVPVAANEEMIERFEIKNEQIWGGRNVCLNWYGEEPVTVYFLPTCDTEATSYEAAVDSFMLHKIKTDEDHYAYYLRANEEIKYLKKKALDNNLYLAIKAENHGNGSFCLTEWTEDCETTSADWDITPEGVTYSLEAMQHTNLYKLYKGEFWAPSAMRYTTPDKIRFTWTGSSTLTLFLAKDCNFNLNPDDRNVVETLTFTAGTSSVEVDRTQSTLWAAALTDVQSEYMYIRCQNSATGTLQIIGLDYPPAPIEPVYITMDTILCEGRGYSVNGTTYRQSTQGIQYTENHGDTTYNYTVNLIIMPRPIEYDTIRAYDLNNLTYSGIYSEYAGRAIPTTAGDYIWEYTRQDDCHSELHLCVIKMDKPYIHYAENIELCEGQYYMVGSHKLENNGDTESVRVETESSIVETTYTLTILPATSLKDTVEVQQLNTLYQVEGFEGLPLTHYGVNNLVFTADNVCTQRRDVFVKAPDVHEVIDTTLCVGKSLSINGVEYTQTALLTEIVYNEETYSTLYRSLHIVFTQDTIFLSFDTPYSTYVYTNDDYPDLNVVFTDYGVQTVPLEIEGCVVIFVIEHKQTTDVSDITFANLTVRPTLIAQNETVTVNAEDIGRLLVLDVLGRVVLDLPANNHFEFSLANAGNYVIRFISDEHLETVKLIVK